MAAYPRIMRDIEENCSDIKKVKSVGFDMVVKDREEESNMNPRL